MKSASEESPRRGSGLSLAARAIRNPVTVSMLFLSIVVMGAIALFRIPLMLFPSLDAPVMFISADYYNATPEQVLESITKPIEESIATVPGVQRMNSTSSANGLRIQIWCGMGADTSMLRAAMREKIERIRNELPEDLRQIYIRNFTTDEIPILEGTLTARRDLRSSYDYLDARVKEPLERIHGVGNVDLWGASRKQVDIYLRIDDIKRYGVDVAALYRSLEGSAQNLSLGRVSAGGQRFTAVARGAIEAVEEIRNYPIGQHGLVLADVADVVFDQRPRNSGRHQNGMDAVGLAVQKTSEGNTVEVVRQVKAAFERWQGDPSMDGLEVKWWHDSGEQIEEGLTELLAAGSVGAVLAVAVLFLFLRRVAASLAVSLAIPFSVLSAIGLLYFSGGSLNILSMMGLMLAAGMLVDNAVVVFEAIFQRFERGERPAAAAAAGADEVTVAVIAATSTTMIIFVPLLLDTESQLSTLLSHVGLSIIFALLCSLFISLTLIPLALSKVLGASPAGGGLAGAARKADGRPPDERGLQRSATAQSSPFFRRYLAVVRWHLDRRYVLGLLAVPALLGAAGWALVEVVPNNSPDARAMAALRIEYEFTENYHYAKIEEDFVKPVEEFLHSNAERFKIQSTSSGYGNNMAWTRVYLDAEEVTTDEIGNLRVAINDALPEIPGARIEMGREGDGDRSWISVNLYGDDPTELRELARQARELLLDKPQITEVYTDLTGSRNEVRVRMRREVAARYDVSPQTIAQVLGITVRSRRMREFRLPQGEVELWVGLHPADMQNLDDLKSVVVGSGSSGEPVLLGNVADLQLSKVPGSVHRENRRTFAEMAVVYQGDRAENGRATVEEVLSDLPLQPGYRWSFGFWTQQQNQDVQDFLLNLALAFVMVYFVMAALFESVLHPIAIMLSLPFSIVGIVIVLLVTATPFTEMAQVGLIILVGVVVNNGIVLINHINNLRREGVVRRQAVLTGCRERLRPICMTAATTVVGLVPLAVGDASLMGTNYFPLARTIIGGLIASTGLTLIVLPTYYVLLDDVGQWFRRLWHASQTETALA